MIIAFKQIEGGCCNLQGKEWWEERQTVTKECKENHAPFFLFKIEWIYASAQTNYAYNSNKMKVMWLKLWDIQES